MDEPITGPAVIAVGILNWLEARKLRILFETNANALRASVKPAFVVKPRRKSRPKKRRPSDATMAAMEARRGEKLRLDRDKHEWRKNRDIAKAAKWFVEWMSGDQFDD